MQLIKLLILLVFTCSFSLAQDEARLLRFPAIFDNQVVFTYAGDLYTVDANGGVARKLTNHDGFEMFARFSPDGKNLAFTGQYDGNTEVFLMPSNGGSPTRLTFTATLNRDDVADRMGPNNIVMAWKKDGSQVAFRSRKKSYNSFNGSLFLVSPKGGLPEQIPVPRGGFLSFSDDGSQMAYNRVFREFRTWKKYRGGMADDVWIFDFKTKKIENITNNPAQDIIPMWLGNRIYFLSDRDENKRMNLYSYDLTSKQTKKLTQYSEFDIKFPSLGKTNIVYENGGYLYKFDTQSEKSSKIKVIISDDFLGSRKELKDVSKSVSNYEISPDGKRALFGARGDVFTVPVKEGQTRNLTKSSAIHERNSKWSPDGKWIAFISDKSGEDEIYIQAQDGSANAVQITKNGETYKYQMYWSPDSKKLLWGDRRQRLRYVDIDSKKIKEVTKANAWEIRNYAWSPDSKWITYEFPEEEVMNRIYVYSLSSGEAKPVTESWYNSSNPVFSQDGKYLYFTSNRDFNPIYSNTEWNHAYQDMSRIYILPLTKSAKSPFAPESDEVAIKSKEKRDKKDKDSKDKKVTVKVDFAGIENRVIGLPVSASNYFSIVSVGDKLYYGRRGSKDAKTKLLMYNFKDKEEKDLGEVNGYEISADGKKMLASANGSYAIIDLPSAPVKLDKKLNLAGMEVLVDKKTEWKQIFNENWRQMREFFYAPNMHGVDWLAIKKKYEPLLAYVNHRNDLTYIMGEMVGELNVGHAYVGGGDRTNPKRIKLGLLGAQIKKDASGYYKITKILNGENWNNRSRSPLTEVGVDVSVGDFIIAVDGKDLKSVNNIYTTLINKAGKQTILKVNKNPQEKGARTVTVKPVADESRLYYLDWVNGNIEKVNKATNGEVGYIHIPDMGRGGLNEFVKHFYPQIRKKALIVDVRGNGGGNVSPMIIERLRREAVMINMARNTSPGPNPGSIIYGPMIALADEFSASDGDIFTFRFKKHKLGKVVGKRTWGGVVGIRGSLPFVDGGDLRKPEFSRYDLEGKKWLMEGIGVEPDIYVDNDPYKEFTGEDQQLNRAVKEIMDELKTKKKEIKPIPAYPDRR
ncbi:MAG: protease [Calditrichaeota bacterium]|nr:MAG: protease [Calditrichota bacterium]MBL1206760.1 protease [Calditrichota bacterium]NOG46586.1 protease [Calditrichota bacterium]